MIKGIHHVALVVRDIVAAERYYCAVAGMHRLPAEAALALVPAGLELTPHSSFEHAVLAGRNGYLELLGPQRPLSAPDAAANPINRVGIRHLCVQNSDCSALETAVLGSGGSLIAASLDLGTGNQYAYARDPEANIMEIEGLPYAPVGEPNWFGHVAVVTRDMDQAITFYGSLLGSQPQNRGRFGPGPQFDRMSGLVDVRIEGAWLQFGNMLLELWHFHTPESSVETTAHQFFNPGYSHLCFETDSLSTEAARLIQLGGKLLTECKENDRFRSVFALDPEGNIIELLEPRQPDGPLSIAALAEPGICARVEARRCMIAARARPVPLNRPVDQQF